MVTIGKEYLDDDDFTAASEKSTQQPKTEPFDARLSVEVSPAEHLTSKQIAKNNQKLARAQKTKKQNENRKWC